MKYSSQDVADKWEGRTPLYNVGNRVGGTCMAVFGALFLNSGHTSFDLAGLFFLTEGIGDLLTGHHHYVSSRTIFYRYLNGE